MGHPIPKIEWDSVNDIEFDYPPSVDDGDNFLSSNAVSTSISGVKQVSTNYIEVQRNVTMSFVSETIKALMDDFMQDWALTGNQFKYFEDKALGTFAYYELSAFSYNSKKVAPVTANAYLWEIPIAMRRVLGIAGGEETVFTILNNQSAAVNVSGLVFDKSQYTQAIVTCELRRTTSTQEVRARVVLTAIYDAINLTWNINTDTLGDDCGVTFSITSAGQIQYTSTNLTGSNYVGTLKAKQSTFSA